MVGGVGDRGGQGVTMGIKSCKGNAAKAVLDAPKSPLSRRVISNSSPGSGSTPGETTAPPAGSAAFHSHREAYCEWMTQNLAGIETSMECIEADGNHVVEFRNRLLVSMHVT